MPNSDLDGFRRAVQLRDRCRAAAVAAGQRLEVPMSPVQANVAFDAMVDLIRDLRPMAEPTARFGIAVHSDNGAHVRFRLFAATGGAHLGGCGDLVMRPDEYATFRQLLAPALTDRPDPPEGGAADA